MYWPSTTGASLPGPCALVSALLPRVSMKATAPSATTPTAPYTMPRLLGALVVAGGLISTFGGGPIVCSLLSIVEPSDQTFDGEPLEPDAPQHVDTRRLEAYEVVRGGGDLEDV